MRPGTCLYLIHRSDANDHFGLVAVLRAGPAISYGSAAKGKLSARFRPRAVIPVSVTKTPSYRGSVPGGASSSLGRID